VEVQTGTLSLNGGGTATGSSALSAGTTLNLSGGTHNFSAASTITGPATFIVSGGTANLNGLVNVTGANTFSGGTANITGNYIETNGTLNVTGGTALFNGVNALTPAVLNLANGYLGGTNMVTVGTTLNWSGAGTMGGSGRTVIAPGAVANVDDTSYYVYLDVRTLENAGTVNRTGGVWGFELSNGAVVTNRAGAVINELGDGGIINGGGSSAGRLDNAGTFQKTGGTGTTAVNLAFNNGGTVNVQSGTVALSAAIVRSHSITNSQPPPSTWPCTEAITGFCISHGVISNSSSTARWACALVASVRHWFSDGSLAEMS